MVRIDYSDFLDEMNFVEEYKSLINLPDNIRELKYIIIHHSLTKDSQTVSWDAIRKYHMGLIEGSNYKMSDIGYHFGIELISSQVKIMLGRNVNTIGAHTSGLNTSSIGICVVGDYDKVEPDHSRFVKAMILCKLLCNKYNIDVNNIIGHRESYVLLNKPVAKSCPGKLWNMDYFREETAVIL